MKKIGLLIIFLLVGISAHAQLKPEAMSLPIIFTGISSAEERAIIQSHVINELSVNFDLKSEKEVEQAREFAVDKISSENCTEEACIKQMGELLDVEYTFTFKIIAAGNYWDLSAIRVDTFMEKTVRRNIACEDCNLSRARLLLTELILGLRPGTTTVKSGEAVLQIETEPRSLIFLEGIEQGSTPLELTVPTDRPAEILAVAEGYQDYSNLFELKSGEQREIKIPLVPRRGSVKITSVPPGASIILDGKQLTSSGGQPLRTPATIRPVYGERDLKLMLEKHENLETEININRPNLRTKKYTLKPNPGRLIIRVPVQLKNADLFINGREIGDMGGKVAKGVQADANVSLNVQAKQGDFETDIKSVEVGPEERKKVEFTEFSDLRVIELRKKKEEEKKRKWKEEREELLRKQENAKSERRRKEHAAKIKENFENMRVEIRTFGHLMEAPGYSIYFYFDPRFGIGYFREVQEGESSPSSTAPYYYYDATFKYSIENKGYVFRIRFLEKDNYGWNSLRYLVDSWGMSLFSSSGKITGKTTIQSANHKTSGLTIDYVWYWENGFSLLFGLGFANINTDEYWTENWETLNDGGSWGWGLLNIGYMF